MAAKQLGFLAGITGVGLAFFAGSLWHMNRTLVGPELYYWMWWVVFEYDALAVAAIQIRSFGAPGLLRGLFSDDGRGEGKGKGKVGGRWRWGRDARASTRVTKYARRRLSRNHRAARRSRSSLVARPAVFGSTNQLVISGASRANWAVDRGRARHTGVARRTGGVFGAMSTSRRRYASKWLTWCCASW